MRKIFLGFTFFLVLACNWGRVAPAPAPTSSQGLPTPESIVQITEPAGAGTIGPVEIVPVPVSPTQIEGVPYSAYQMPGDPFRFVCQEPCRLDPQFILAEYAGFRVARAELIRLTGVDTLAELQPVDMHLENEDSVCQEWPGGHAYIYADTRQAYTCTNGPGLYRTVEETIRMAARPEQQYFPLHEYMHTMFFGRISSKAGKRYFTIAESMHDFVNPIPAYAIGGLDRAEFCSYRDPLPQGDFDGWLISELCRRNGFQLTDLAPSLIALDGLYQSGGGRDNREGYAHPVPSVAQYRDILNRLLGSDTTPAFAAACWPPELFGDSYSLSAPCAIPDISGSPTPIQ
jgi:hypothetical protein